MKLSVSLPDADVQRLDDFAKASGLPTRSAVVQYAIRQLQFAQLQTDYEAAWEEWEASGEAAAWEGVTGDGLRDATR